MALEPRSVEVQRHSPRPKWQSTCWPLSCLAVALSIAFAPAASAQTIDPASRKAAGALGAVGLEAYMAGQYEQARDKLEKAFAIAKVPTLGLWSGRALRQLGLWVEAEARFRETIGLRIPEGAPDQVALQKKALVEAQTELGALTPAIPQLSIELVGARWADVTVTLDGHPISGDEGVRRVNPGVHRLNGQVGAQRQELSLRLEPSEKRTASLHFHGVEAFGDGSGGAGSGATDWKRIAGWSAVGLGGAGLVLGTITGILAMNEKGDIDDSANCVGNRCSPAENDLVDSYNGHRNLSSFGFIAGGVVAAAGVTLLVLADSSERPRAEAFVSPGLAGIRGDF